MLWGTPDQKSDDVSASGAYLHQTLLAENATGLRNLFKLSSLASYEGQLGKWARMDADLMDTTRLDDDLAWRDVFGMSLLAGIGFTVSLLIGELAFGFGTVDGDHVKVGVFVASLVSAGLAALVLTGRNRVYRRIAEAETVDANADGIPDVYQRED